MAFTRRSPRVSEIIVCFWVAIVLRDFERIRDYIRWISSSETARSQQISFATKYAEDEVFYMKKVSSVKTFQNNHEGAQK